MNRRYALWQHEWQSMRWFLALSILFAITTCVLLHQNMVVELTEWNTKEWGYYWEYGCIFSVQLFEAIALGGLWILPAFAIMSAFHFRDKQSCGVREYFMSLPYSKNERFWIKIGMGYGTITTFCIVLTVGVLIVRNQVMSLIETRNATWPLEEGVLPQETIGDVLCTLFVSWLALLAIYSIFVLIQTIVNHGVLAAVFSVITTIAPFCMLAAVFNVAEKVVGHNISFFGTELWNGFYTKVVQFIEKAISTIMEQEYISGYIGEEYYECYVVKHDDMWLGVIVFGMTWLVCTLIAWLVWKRQDEAKAGFLVAGKIPRLCVSIAVSLGAALFVSLIFFMWLEIGEFIKYTLITIGLTIALWFILKKRAR